MSKLRIIAHHSGPVSMRYATRRFFPVVSREHYELVSSSIMLDEIREVREGLRSRMVSLIRGQNVKIWFANPQVRKLASLYIRRKVIPAQFYPDAEHIAAASVLGTDALFSWNLRHIVNLRTKSAFKKINRTKGYRGPENPASRRSGIIDGRGWKDGGTGVSQGASRHKTKTLEDAPEPIQIAAEESYGRLSSPARRLVHRIASRESFSAEPIAAVLTKMG